MGDILPNVVIPSNIWVDLYDSTGISVGTQILVQNNGDYLEIYLQNSTATVNVLASDVTFTF